MSLGRCHCQLLSVLLLCLRVVDTRRTRAHVARHAAQAAVEDVGRPQSNISLPGLHIAEDSSLFQTGNNLHRSGKGGSYSNQPKSKNKKGSTCPTFPRSARHSSDLVVQMPSGSNMPMLQGAWGARTDYPDTYVVLQIALGQNTYSLQTSVEKNRFEPRWAFQCALPLPDDVDVVSIAGQVLDSNRDSWVGRPDKVIGHLPQTVWHVGTGKSSSQSIYLSPCLECRGAPASVLITTSSKKSSYGEVPWLPILFVLTLIGALAMITILFWMSMSRSNRPDPDQFDNQYGNYQSSQGFYPPPHGQYPLQGHFQQDYGPAYGGPPVGQYPPQDRYC